MTGFVLASFGSCALAFAFLLLMLLVSRNRVWPQGHIAMLSLAMIAWSALMVWAPTRATSFAWLILLDTPQTFGVLWVVGEIIRNGAPDGWLRRFGTAVRLVGLLPGALLLVAMQFAPGAAGGLAIYSVIGVTAVGLLAIEQLYRNAVPERRGAMGLLSAALGVILVFDFFVYSQSMMAGSLGLDLWASRGFVNMLAAPVLVMALRRNPQWETSLFVSRHVMFYSASLVAVGLYLIAIAFGGVLIRRYGGELAGSVQAVFFAASLLMLFLVLFSQQARRRLRVFLAKHFYRNRYDYREEWLKLIRRLAQEEHRAPLNEKCLYALADILGSESGALWLRDADGSAYVRAATIGPVDTPDRLPAGHPLVAFLERSGWIVDGDQYRTEPGSYDVALETEDDDDLLDGRIFVPIVLGDVLTGVVALARPPSMSSMNFEDHDLLRTVGRQLAVFLEQDRGRRLLEETRQFEVFNRFTAFVMHDLKNLIAQLSLVVSNAAAHKHNPEFVDDAIDTIANSVRRMNNLLEQLQGGSINRRVSTVTVHGLLKQVEADVAARVPAPRFELEGEDARVLADPDRLENVLTHIVRNAQDATASDGSVVVRVEPLEMPPHGPSVRIRVTDTGSGMSEAFIRDRLFKPFDSTKGAQGMGIGAYQARDYINEIGGTLDVESRPGVGSMFTIVLPVAGRRPDTAQQQPTEDPECVST